MTKGKQGKKEASGDAVLPPEPECYGFFMNPVHGSAQCKTCSYLIECYTKWKELGEPSGLLKRVCPTKYEGRCAECEGL